MMKYLKGALMNLLGGAVLAFGVYNVHSVSGVTEGGALGLALLCDHWLHISPAVTNIVISLVCYVLGLATFGKGFLVYSGIAAGSFSMFYALFECFPRVYPAIAGMPLAASIIGALFVGCGCGLCVRYGGAPNADDALAMSISRRFRLPIQRIYLMSDITVLALSLSYIPLKRIAFSLITVFLSGRLIGFIAGNKISAVE